MKDLRIVGLIIVLFTSCQERFDSRRWKKEDDLKTYPFREAMIDDLIGTKMLIGLNWSQIQDTLGRPNAVENEQAFYFITENYGLNIDPIFTKFLVLTFDKDSLIVDVKIKEWRK